MNIVVQKYGGSSVATKEKIDIISNNLIEEYNKGNGVVCVVSAQGKTTDKLVNLAREYVGEDTKNYTKEMDMLLSTGEIQTVALLTMTLKNKGYDALGFTGGMAGIITDSNYSNAKILSIVPDNILNNINNGKIIVVARFSRNR
jgi:aspartate kinase